MSNNRKLKVITIRVYGVADDNGDQISPDFAMRDEAVSWLKEYENAIKK